MFKRRWALSLIIISLMLLPGCWSRKELNELAVVMALGVDLHEKGFTVSAQVLNSGSLGKQKENSFGSLPVVTYKATGATIPDALQRMLSSAPRLMYLSHIRVLVLGEGLARKGISDVLDFVARDHQLRDDFYMLVAKGSKADEVLEIMTPFEHVPASSLYSSIMVANKNWAATGKVTIKTFVTELERGGSNPILSGVEVHGNVDTGSSLKNIQATTPKTMLHHAGIAVFQKDKLVGWLDESASKAVNYMLNGVNTTIGNIPCPGDDGSVGFIIYGAKRTYGVKLNEEGRPEFSVKLKIEANVNAVQCTIDLSKAANMEEIGHILEDKFNSNISRHIKKVQQEYGSDIFGFGEELHRKYPKAWKKYRENWDEVFRTSPVSVKTEVQMRRVGSIVQSLERQMEEK
ncbi:Ger(x)C family spore germination protein [Paenibacillus sp. JDR-2]|uniref:Ger(x)C family spore germination protein n=1 Tax=Paenibacillus sp. (strain JDR-2) TaxID=324057 RepID=UPI0001665A7E|nr:Ger(x)C family spore germination protein [Paenibacillus sp. JDR-2]ACT01721.1 germination protein, Ger(x)C family [Paenibacillus sp. JDR-2]